MSNTCEIISPSRSSKTIRTNGLIPFIEGANDLIEEIVTPKNDGFINSTDDLSYLVNDKDR